MHKNRYAIASTCSCWAGSPEMNSIRIYRPSRIMRTEISRAVATAMRLADRIPVRMRSYFRAPRFWPDRLREIIIGVAGKLIIVPAIFLPIAIAMGFRDAELVALLALFGSPTAVSSFTMAQQMGGDSELAGHLVVLGSLFSIITMFFWIFALKQLGFI